MKTEWDAITRIKAENRAFKKRIAELESDNKALIVEGDELDKRWISRDKRITELEEENASLQAYAFRVIAFVTRAVEKLRGVPEFKPTGYTLNRVLRLTPKIALEAHNLDQQAKGILEAVEYLGWEGIYTDTCPKQSIGREFRFVAGQLTKEAKTLKEQGK